jgi:hypothetical protein
MRFSAPAPADSVAPTGCVPTDATGRPIQLGQADNGRTICLRRWQRLYVTLSVDPVRYPNPSNWWTPVQASGGVLAAPPLPAPPPQGPGKVVVGVRVEVVGVDAPVLEVAGRA